MKDPIKFKSAIGNSVKILIGMLFLAGIASAILTLYYKHDAIVPALIFMNVFWITGFILLFYIRSLTYELDDERFSYIVRKERRSIPLNTITAFSIGKNLPGEIKVGFASEGILLHHHGNDSIFICPVNQEKFIALLLEKRHEISRQKHEPK